MGKDEANLSDKLKSLSYHITKACNFRCRFCYAHFYKVPTRLNKEKMLQIIQLLMESGTEKITFAGGEPTLVPFLPELVNFASDIGMTTVIITNGSKINQQYLDLMKNKLDWVGLSIDSGKEDINLKLGRGDGEHVKKTIQTSKLLRENGIIVKINTVVTSLTWNEDMNWLIEETRPKRWKVFQMLPIKGENDNANDLKINDQQFKHFKHLNSKSKPVIESNNDMKGGYVMIDPEGRFFNNDTGELTHGPPILKVGVEEAFKFSRFSYDKFLGRGGNYKWKFKVLNK